MAKYSLSPGVVEVNDSTLNETKENIRLDQIIPSEIIADKPAPFISLLFYEINFLEILYTNIQNSWKDKH